MLLFESKLNRFRLASVTYNLTALGRKMSQISNAVTARITATATRMLQIRLRIQQPQQRRQLPMQLKQQQHPGGLYRRFGLSGGGTDGP